MSLRFKLDRIRRYSGRLGLREATRLELLWSTPIPRVDVRVPGHHEPFTLRRRGSDLAVFETVFVEQELALELPRAPRLIIDGGANVGLSTAFFAQRYPTSHIIAVEPDRTKLQLLRRNCRGYTNVSVVEGGLWPVSGALRIANPHDEPSTFRCELAEPGSPDTFPAYAIADLIRHAGFTTCDLLKLDVEGAEEFLFNDASPWLDRVQCILVETHSERGHRAMLEACPSSRWNRDVRGEKAILMARRDLREAEPVTLKGL
ncbi:MAG: FkbM family methyltransferase [Myxococcales bacterium]